MSLDTVKSKELAKLKANLYELKDETNSTTEGKPFHDKVFCYPTYFN